MLQAENNGNSGWHSEAQNAERNAGSGSPDLEVLGKLRLHLESGFRSY